MHAPRKDAKILKQRAPTPSLSVTGSNIFA
jgi:hypothetical protein